MLPTLSCMSVRSVPESRLRFRCSTRYQRISPLHRVFQTPFPVSSGPVSDALPELSPGISRRTWSTACARFTPSKSEQRSSPLYYRGCWHRVSRDFLWKYNQTAGLVGPRVLFPPNSSLQPEGLHPARSVALSGFRPPIANDPRLQPPVGVWAVSQSQCG